MAKYLLGILVQLVLVALLLFMLSGYASETIGGTAFAQEVQATDNALLAETLMIRSDGRTTLNTFLDKNTYRLEATPQEFIVALRGQEGTGRSARYAHPADAQLPDTTLRQQGIAWSWYQNTLGVEPISLALRCPQLSTPPAWEELGGAGDQAAYATRTLEDAYGERGYYAGDNINTPATGEEGFVLRIDHADQLAIETGAGAFNDRLHCLLAQELPDANLTRTQEDRDYLHLLAPDPQDHRAALVQALREALR